MKNFYLLHNMQQIKKISKKYKYQVRVKNKKIEIISKNKNRK